MFMVALLDGKRRFPLDSFLGCWSLIEDEVRQPSSAIRGGGDGTYQGRPAGGLVCLAPEERGSPRDVLGEETFLEEITSADGRGTRSLRKCRGWQQLTGRRTRRSSSPVLS
jgi:hypothetical protein